MKKILRLLLLLVNLLAIAALLLSTLSGVIPPSRSSLVTVFSYGYFVLLLINVLFILVWLLLSRWEFLLSLAAILVRCSFIPLFFQVGGNTDAGLSDSTLRIMTFNAHGFKGLDSDTLMTADSGFALFLQILDEEQPDIVNFQEFWANSSLIDSMSSRGYRHRYGIHGDNTSSATILYSRCPITYGHMIDSASKYYADIEKNGHQVRICGVHLDSYQLGDEDRQGLKNLSHAQPDSTTHRLIGKLTETSRTHQHEWDEQLKPLVEASTIPFVLMGDFNDTPASYIYQHATRLLMDPYVEQGRGF